MENNELMERTQPSGLPCCVLGNIGIMSHPRCVIVDQALISVRTEPIEHSSPALPLWLESLRAWALPVGIAQSRAGAYCEAPQSRPTPLDISLWSVFTITTVLSYQ
jgi:hypothetical protein